MKRHPVTLRRQSYRGSQPGRQARTCEYNRVAAKVEEFLQETMERLPKAHCVQVFVSYQVANKIEEPPELVRRIISTIDAGANGVTLWKGEYERALDDLKST